MKEIFKSILGIIFLTSLFIIFEAVIQYNLPELALLASLLRGFVWVTVSMGFVIIIKSGYELISVHNYKD